MDAKPISYVFRICQRSRKTHEANLVTSLLSDVAHSGDDNFDDGTSVLSQQVDLIDDNESYV